jgi:hypothetical protein
MRVNKKWLWLGFISSQIASWFDTRTLLAALAGIELPPMTPLQTANVVASGVFVVLLLAVSNEKEHA